MIRRRELIAGISAAAWPVAAWAQQGERVRRVGVLMPLPNDDPDALAEMAALRRGLAERGWIEGRTIDVAVQWVGDDPIEASAKELVGAKPDVLLSRSTPTTAALNNERGLIPLVFVNVAEPVEQGLVQSFSQPGTNITGFTNLEASAGSKMMQLLKEIDPQIVRVSHIGSGERCCLRVVNDDMGEHRAPIILAAARNSVPAVYGDSSFARDGGFLSYGIDQVDLWRRAATYVDRILRGAKPGDLPVQFPTKYEMAMNLKTAKALGLTIPPSILALANEVIE